MELLGIKEEEIRIKVHMRPVFSKNNTIKYIFWANILLVLHFLLSLRNKK